MLRKDAREYDFSNKDEFNEFCENFELEDLDKIISGMSYNPFDSILRYYMDEYLEYLCESDREQEAEYHAEMYSRDDDYTDEYTEWARNMCKTIIEYIKNDKEKDRTEEAKELEIDMAFAEERVLRYVTSCKISKSDDPS